jgi:hypothetical protein
MDIKSTSIIWNWAWGMNKILGQEKWGPYKKPFRNNIADIFFMADQ